MISSISYRPAVASAPVRAHAPAAPAAAPAEDAFDPIGLGDVDTVQKAMQLPIMDPVYQGSVGLGLVAVALGGAFGTALNASVRGETSSDGTPANITQFNASARGDKLGGLVGGYVAMNYFMAGELSVDQGKHVATWRETFGSTDVELNFSVDEGSQQLTMDGHLGSVPAHLVYTGVQTAAGGAVINVEGILGGQDYKMQTSLDTIPTDQGQSTFNISTRGNVGDLTVDKTYQGQVDIDQEGRTVGLTIDGSGQNAGHQQTVNVRAAVGPA
ncbi:MAG: hypothetical protein AB7S38_14215 [Vulcanimicrobiota bacterium]